MHHIFPELMLMVLKLSPIFLKGYMHFVPFVVPVRVLNLKQSILGSQQFLLLHFFEIVNVSLSSSLFRLNGVVYIMGVPCIFIRVRFISSIRPQLLHQRLGLSLPQQKRRIYLINLIIDLLVHLPFSELLLSLKPIKNLFLPHFISIFKGLNDFPLRGLERVSTYFAFLEQVGKGLALFFACYQGLIFHYLRDEPIYQFSILVRKKRVTQVCDLKPLFVQLLQYLNQQTDLLILGELCISLVCYQTPHRVRVLNSQEVAQALLVATEKGLHVSGQES